MDLQDPHPSSPLHVVCKTLEGPVMDVLWQRQKYLHIILRTLPADCWIVTDRVYVSENISRPSKPLISPTFQHVTKTPTTNEWERFRTYAARVVELFVGKLYSGKVSSEAISFLGMRSILDPLWPRLTSLRLTGGLGWDAVLSTLTFLSPKTTNLTLILPQDSNTLLQPALSIASNRCHSLQELVLEIVVGDSNSSHGVGELLSACRGTLRILEIRSPFKVEYLSIIASLPYLRSLRLEEVDYPCDLPSNAFLNLEEVVILRFRGQRLQDFFKRLCTTRLKAVNIHGASDAIAFKESVAALSRSSASLMALKVTNVANLDLPNVVVPRLFFANLRYLRVGCPCWREDVHGPCAFQPTDQAITELGVAMPNIIHLTLGSPTCLTPPCATFMSLVSLSKTCQDLETLVIGVDFQTMVAPSIDGNRDIETGATFYGTQGNPCKLRTLILGPSTLPDHPESGWIVATGLGRIFPSLSELAGYGLDRDKWEKVGRSIRMIRRVLRTVQQ